jgi:two-component system, OmpR family, sensor histidine kinase VicK
VTKNNLLSAIKAIGELSNDGMLLYSIGRKNLDYVNHALLKMFDISHDAFRHQPAFFVNHVISEDVEYLKSEYKRLLAEHKIENVEFRLKSHDGIIIDVSCNCYVLENGKYAVGILKDFTNIREHEDYIINYGAKKNTLLEMVNHNLSGPLTVTKNIVESLENIVKDQDVRNINAHIQLIKENTRHCIELVNDFLEEEHLVSENIFTKKNRFEVTDKVNTVLERFRKSYPDYEFVVQKNFDTLYINNDDVKFLQVVNNLISNAIKWSRSGTVIEVNMHEYKDTFSLAVKDHGIGIPEHFKVLIFDKNTRAARSGLKGEKSVGMGLYIVKKLVNLMDGNITFESKENEGTTFVLSLPKDEPTENNTKARLS